MRLINKRDLKRKVWTSKMNETVSKSVFLMQKSFTTLNLRRLKKERVISKYFVHKIKILFIISVGKKKEKKAI